jgi:hypothetical protein
MRLILFTRRGCCLCDALRDRLLALPPPWPLEERDVDADPRLRSRYDLEVPVLARAQPGQRGWTDLPRVSPRLEGAALRRWLERAMAASGEVAR